MILNSVPDYLMRRSLILLFVPVYSLMYLKDQGHWSSVHGVWPDSVFIVFDFFILGQGIPQSGDRIFGRRGNPRIHPQLRFC